MKVVLLFTVVALAEMAAFIWVGSVIGFGWALGIALVTAVLGSILVRRAGISVWGRFRGKANEGVLPGRELSDGAAILVSGAFLISPGFITDTLGFLLLIPAVRDVIYRNITKRLSGSGQCAHPQPSHSPGLARWLAGSPAVRDHRRRGRRPVVTGAMFVPDDFDVPAAFEGPWLPSRAARAGPQRT